MKISLILCTVDRVLEIEFFLDSLIKQTYKNFELIVVDQNKDDQIKKIIKKYSQIDIKYLYSQRGLSKSRNKGLEVVVGDIVCFPDDDCTYPAELLENVKFFFEFSDYDILMGKAIDRDSGQIVAGNTSQNEQKLSKYYTLGSSTTLFVKNIGNYRFDERFGLGGIFGSEEENDLVLRLLRARYKGYYSPNINYVYHPSSDIDYSNVKRIKERSIGLGSLIAKHIVTLEGACCFIKYNIIKPLVGSIIYFVKLDFTKSKFYFYKWLGIWKGFILFFMYSNDSSL